VLKNKRITSCDGVYCFGSCKYHRAVVSGWLVEVASGIALYYILCCSPGVDVVDSVPLTTTLLLLIQKDIHDLKMNSRLETRFKKPLCNTCDMRQGFETRKIRMLKAH